MTLGVLQSHSLAKPPKLAVPSRNYRKNTSSCAGGPSRPLGGGSPAAGCAGGSGPPWMAGQEIGKGQAASRPGASGLVCLTLRSPSFPVPVQL